MKALGHILILITYLAVLAFMPRVGTAVEGDVAPIELVLGLAIPTSELPPEMHPIRSLLIQSDFKGAAQLLRKRQQRIVNLLGIDKHWLLRGIVLEGLGRMEDAEKAYQTTLKFRGSNSDARFLRARRRFMVGDLKVARQELEEALWFGRADWAQPVIMLSLLADIQLAMEDKEAAIATLHHAIDKDPGAPAPVLKLVELLLQNAQRNDALAVLEKAVEHNQASTELKVGLARALIHDTSVTINRAAIERAAELTSILVTDLNIEQRCASQVFPLYVRTQLSLGELDNVERDLNSALVHCPEQPELLILLSQLKLQQQAVNPSPSVSPIRGSL